MRILHLRARLFVPVVLLVSAICLVAGVGTASATARTVLGELFSGSG